MRNSKNTVQGISRQALLRLPNYLNYLKNCKRRRSNGLCAEDCRRLGAKRGSGEKGYRFCQFVCRQTENGV